MGASSERSRERKTSADESGLFFIIYFVWLINRCSITLTNNFYLSQEETILKFNSSVTSHAPSSYIKPEGSEASDLVSSEDDDKEYERRQEEERGRKRKEEERFNFLEAQRRRAEEESYRRQQEELERKRQAEERRQKEEEQRRLREEEWQRKKDQEEKLRWKSESDRFQKNDLRYGSARSKYILNECSMPSWSTIMCNALQFDVFTKSGLATVKAPKFIVCYKWLLALDASFAKVLCFKADLWTYRKL